MYGILPGWLKSWLFGSTIICSLDVAFTTLRPETLPGGRLDRYFFLCSFPHFLGSSLKDPFRASLCWCRPALRGPYRSNDSGDRSADGRGVGIEFDGTIWGKIKTLFIWSHLLPNKDLFRPTHFHALMAAFTSSTLVFWKTTIYLGLYLVPMFYGAILLLPVFLPTFSLWNFLIYLEVGMSSLRLKCFSGGQNLLALDTPAWKAALLFWLPNSIWVFVPLVAMFYLWRAIGRGWTHRRLAAEENDEDEESEHFEGIP
jgi:hypothetical protein